MGVVGAIRSDSGLGMVGRSGRHWCAGIDRGAGSPIRQAQGRLSGDAGMTGARRARDGGWARRGVFSRSGECVQSVGPMCSVLGAMCPVFGRMCSVSRGMCPLWRAMCPVSGWGAFPRFLRPRGGMTRGKWLVGGGEWLVTRAGVGLGGVGGRAWAGDGGCWQ